MTVQLGLVASFDAHVGLGQIQTHDGATYPFHCTAITDGSRTIDQGRSVSFVVGPGGPGVWEAVSVLPLP